MEFSTETVKMMAAIMVQEIEQLGMVEGGIWDIETGMREVLRALGAGALGQALERTE